jgi:lysophospholipase L1-like esterase
MPLADEHTYLARTSAELRKPWPANRAVTIVCHGHSVPAGYFKTPVVDTFRAYPHLLHRRLKERFAYAVINVTVTAIGGENAAAGAARFARDVLSLRPDVVTIDYALNDRGLGLERAAAAWSAMLTAARKASVPVLLLTPTLDDGDLVELTRHAAQIRALAAEYNVGLVDSFALWETTIAAGTPRAALLSQSNHPNEAGHTLLAEGLMRWFS